MEKNVDRELCEETACVVDEASEMAERALPVVPTDDGRRLEELEIQIELSLQNYRQLGKALSAIRDERLYRLKGYRTFEDYCRQKWGWKSRQVAYNYIAASRVAEIVQITGQSPNLSQAVELAVLPSEQVTQAIEALALQGKTLDEATVHDVREIVQEIQSRTSMRDEAAVSELPVVPVSCAGDLWVCGGHRQFCGDATSLEAFKKVLGNELADMVFCDPPYSVAYTGKTARKLTIVNDDLGADFYEFLHKACTNILAVTKGAVYICMASSELHTLYRAFTNAGGHWSTFVIWAKQHFTLGRSDYQRMYEPILYGWREGGGRYWCGDRDQADVWFIKRPVANLEHPTMKPVELVERAIRNSSEAGNTILDSFGGSGTTMIACETLNRQARLIELDPTYCDVAVDRWQRFTGLRATLEGDGRTFEEVAGDRLKLAA